ncbi:MAG TPA: DsbA family oxidoreductase [Kofleriaceae bacterium]|nr:DsbA family oxidoreductase [Kofleriaceae bacterium]
MLRLDIWSDIVCPWCFIGKRRLETALGQFAHASEVELVYHSFELDPRAPRTLDTTQSHAERLARKYRMSLAQAQQAIDRTTGLAKAEGLDFRFDLARSGNTFDAHRMLHFARERGVQVEMKERLMRAYFTEGQPIGEAETLAKLAADVGLPEAEAREVLASDRYGDAVRGDEQLAAELGIEGVPFFVLGGRLAVSGAQSPDILLGALQRAWTEPRVELPSTA